MGKRNRDVSVQAQSETRKILQNRLNTLKARNLALKEKSSEQAREQRVIQEARQNLLHDLDRELVAANTPKDSIFISFSGFGRSLGDIASKAANENGLHVKTGFDAEIEVPMVGNTDREESLPNLIMAHILSCDCFLGIWTDDFEGESKPGIDIRGNTIERSSGALPSVWMPFELGVAASYNLPFRLLVMSGTHRLYYEKPFQFQPQMVFKKEHFEKKVSRVVEGLARKVRAKKRR